MTADPHPPRDSDRWDNPDYCPFCGSELTDPGAGFIDHLDSAPTCGARFDEWLDAIRDDMGGEWSG
jgi:hypothetical protein